MRYIRVELHNHTTHSDGEMSVDELISYMGDIGVGAFSLTDHNTMSGIPQVLSKLKGVRKPAFLPGVEITTHYGHILAVGLSNMVDFRMLDPRKPEPFFELLRRNGARVIGINHPFCVGSPITNGCRFEMQINDWSKIDHIEVFNTAFEELDAPNEAAFDVIIGNEKALSWWERLVFHGHRLAAVTGKDIHKRPRPACVFCTWAIAGSEDSLPDSELVLRAIKSQKTIVSKGPLFNCEAVDGGVRVEFTNEFGAWTPNTGDSFVLEARFDTGQAYSVGTDLRGETLLPVNKAKSAAVRLYRGAAEYNNLLAVGPPVYWN